MDDVARVAGVSTSTVSHVVNGTRTVSPATEELVRGVIQDLGYRRNTVARALATARTMIVGLCVPVTVNSTFAVLVDVIERQLAAAGYSMMLHNTRDNITAQARVLHQLVDLRADGIIIAPAPEQMLDGDNDPGGLRMSLGEHTPLVLIDRFTDLDCDQVASEGVEPVRRLTEHLAQRGHRRIAVVAGLSGLSTSVDRLQGYRDAVQALGLDTDPHLVVSGESDAAVTRQGVRNLFDRPDHPTAVVSTNNVMTIGTMRGLADLGLRVPDDVAIVGYDDFEWAELFSPHLTAMSQDLTAMGRRAVELLLARIAEPDADPQRIRIEPTFQHRDSCGCPPHQG
jgi:LacI family transcriptional regulator